MFDSLKKLDYQVGMWIVDPYYDDDAQLPELGQSTIEVCSLKHKTKTCSSFFTWALMFISRDGEMEQAFGLRAEFAELGIDLVSRDGEMEQAFGVYNRKRKWTHLRR